MDMYIFEEIIYHDIIYLESGFFQEWDESLTCDGISVLLEISYICLVTRDR